MLDAILFVLQNPVPEREDEHNDWYTNVHIRDVMRLEGAIAVRRFRAHARQVRNDGAVHALTQRYFTLYECSDLPAVIQGHIDHARTERMPISTAGEMAGSYAYFFAPLTMNASRATVPATGCVISARFSGAPECDAAFEQWFAAHVTALAGTGAATLFRIAARQMAAVPPPHRHLTLFAVDDVEVALASVARALREAPVDEVIVGCHEPLIERLRAEDVRDASEAAQANEQRARAALGDRVYTRATATFRAS